MSLSQLSQLLPLPEEELQQVLDYAKTLSKPEAVSHFSNLLGDSPLAIDFISSFNSSRRDPKAAATPSQPPAPAQVSYNGVPKTKRAPKKQKAAIHTPEARRVQDFVGQAGTAYNKKDNDPDYVANGRSRGSAPTSNNVSRSSTPKPAPAPAPAPQVRTAAGYLISDTSSKSKPKSTPVSRSSTPKPAGASTKISISGGVPMAGQSTALADLDAAIRALEITTNPTLDNPKARKCNCVATRHPLQGAAPNCLSCGKVICVKEGLGPCTHCGAPLLNPSEVQAMMRELRDERGKEKMAADAKANRRADVSKSPAPFSQPRNIPTSTDPTVAEAAARAREHRDKLLNFQAENAQRTTVRDEAADFDVGGAMVGAGGSMWASPEERAKELKKQQKLMRELEWNAKPEYEKRQQVLSIDLAGGKVVRKMAAMQRPVTPPSDDETPWDTRAPLAESSGNKARGGGAFGSNPLLGAVIRPMFHVKGKGAEAEGRESKKKGWRRVQDDLNDNEGVILDGGVYGHGRGDEPGRG